jgi:hypothetical protein
LAAGLATAAGAAAFGFAGFFGVLAGAAAEAGVFFAADFAGDFLATFFAAGFFAALFAGFLAFLAALVFPAFLTTRLVFLERFLKAAAFAVRAPAGLRAFFVLLCDVFLLGVATTKSFTARTE